MLYYYTIFPLEQFLSVLLFLLHVLTDSYLLAIVFLSVTVRIITTPLELLAAKSVKKEHEIDTVLSWQLREIKTKFIGAERHEAINRLYKRYGYHPLYAVRAMFGLLVQLPFFIAAFYMIGESTELKGVIVPLIGDIGKPDAMILGAVNLLPFVMTGVNLLALFTTPDFNKKDSIQGVCIAFVFLLLLYQAPAALLIYWSVNNVISLGKNLCSAVFNFRLNKGIKVLAKKDSAFQANYGVIIFSCLGIGTVPVLYYLNNIAAFDNDITILFLPVITVLCFIAVCFKFSFTKSIQRVLAGFGLSILFCDIFFRANIRQLDGGVTNITVDTVSLMANVLFYFGLPLVLLIWGRRFKRLLVDLAYFSVLILAAVSMYAFFSTPLSASNAGRSGTTEDPRKERQQSAKGLPNIYLLWLDAMETEYTKRYLKISDNSTSFPGFTLFQNNSSNYLFTKQSYTSFMSGTVYNDGSYKEWTKGSVRLRKELKDFGYHVTTYAKKEFISSSDDAFIASEDVLLKQTASRHPFVSDFIAYWLVRSLPSVIANRSLEYGQLLGGLVFTVLNPGAKFSEVKTIAAGIEPLSGVFILKQLIEDEAERGGTDQFITMQAIIPHSPYVIDRECNYRGRIGGDPNDAYFEQVECAGSLVEEFLATLKELNRYDSSLIIVMGDHGAGWAALQEDYRERGAPLNKGFHPWTKAQIVSRSSALLMVKPPATAEGEQLMFSDRESQLVDIYPTVLSLIGYEGSSYPDITGVNVFAVEEPDREKYITYFRPSNVIDAFRADVYDLQYADGKGIYDLTFRSKLRDGSGESIIQCQKELQFSMIESGEVGNYIKTKGLSASEVSGRWSDGHRVDIQFFMPPGGCSEGTVTLEVQGFVSKQKRSQSADVLFNNHRIGEILVNWGEQNSKVFSFVLPQKEYSHGSYETLSFQIKDPVSPMMLGLSSDKRMLGLRFRSILFR